LVHNPQSSQRPKKFQRRINQTATHVDETSFKDGSKTTVAKISKYDDGNGDNKIKKDDNENLEFEEILDQRQHDMNSSTFATELDIAMDRNASEIFGNFNRQIWLLVRSLPELLHNLPKIIDILISFMLSPLSLPERPTPVSDPDSRDTKEENSRQEFIVNLATTDILHLLSVLARDLRHEIHVYLHTKILRRIIDDLLNPPPPPPESEKQPIPLDVTIVEASFRCMAYIFKYDSDLVVADMESMRQYYGKTLGHRRELIRRLSAETFAPLIRKIKNQKTRERHIRRVLRALAATSKQTPTRILLRSQTDAVDGLSELCYQIVRGVSGKLHSDGVPMLRFLLELLETSSENHDDDSNIEYKYEQDLIFGFVSGLLDKLCCHCNSATFHSVSKEMFSVLQFFVEKVHEESKEPKTSLVIVKHLKLIAAVATKKSGSLLEGHSDEDLGPLCDAVSKICSENFFPSLPSDTSPVIIKLLCELWVLLQRRKDLEIRQNIERILHFKFEKDDSLVSASIIVAKTILPHLRDDAERDKTSSALIRAAAKMTYCTDATLELLFAVVSSIRRDPPDDVSIGSTDDFNLFHVPTNVGGVISSEDQNALFMACLLSCEIVPCNYARFSVALRCAPFVVFLRQESMEGNYEKVAKWMIGVLEIAQGSLLVKALAVESLAFLSAKVIELGLEPSFVKNRAMRAIEVARDMIFVDSQSLWVMRSIASLISLVQKFDLRLSGDVDRLFDALVPNLRSKSHFLRLYTLQILVICPVKSFVVDHADLDLNEDLDEETTHLPPGESKHTTGGPVGPCRILETLLKLETLEVSLAQEKKLLSLIEKVEVVARSGRLPVVYVEAACNHLLGVFHIKFAPLWPKVQKTIGVLLNEYEDISWPIVEAELVAVMKDSQIENEVNDLGRDEKIDCTLFDRHFEMCRAWEKTSGQDVHLFRGETLVVDGVVPKFHPTDASTVTESTWKVAEMSHRVVVKHSRVVVPLFLDFLLNHYYPAQSNEQDGRELKLEEFVNHET
jgi:hypothetical protein